MTATTNAQLGNIGQATTAQLAKFIDLKAQKNGRLLSSKMENGFLIVCYRTTAGYFVRATFNQFGEIITKQFFKNWNEIDLEPFNPITFD